MKRSADIPQRKALRPTMGGRERSAVEVAALNGRTYAHNEARSDNYTPPTPEEAELTYAYRELPINSPEPAEEPAGSAGTGRLHRRAYRRGAGAPQKAPTARRAGLVQGRHRRTKDRSMQSRKTRARGATRRGEPRASDQLRRHDRSDRTNREKRRNRRQNRDRPLLQDQEGHKDQPRHEDRRALHARAGVPDRQTRDNRGKKRGSAKKPRSARHDDRSQLRHRGRHHNRGTRRDRRRLHGRRGDQDIRRRTNRPKNRDPQYSAR